MTINNIFCKKCNTRLQFIYYYNGKKDTPNKYQQIPGYMICPNHKKLIKVQMKKLKIIRYNPVIK